MILRHHKLQEWQRANLYRTRHLLQSAQGHTVHYDNKLCISFASNDYLGLANHPKIIAAFKHAAENYGVGSGASHLVVGHHQLHRQLEEAFAEFLQRDRALLFANGYMANVGVITALAEHYQTILLDRHNHASLVDASRFSNIKVKRFLHDDMGHLKKQLNALNHKNSLIISDGVFSTHGDIASLPKLISISHQYQAILYIDDAHGIGVLGGNGRGITEHFPATQKEVPILVCPLGKAFGSYGAIVAGSYDLIENLIQFARSYIYTTAIPPAFAAASLAALHVIRTENWRREKLKHLIRVFTKQAKERKLSVIPSITPIQALLIGDTQKAMQMNEQLLQSGYLVAVFRPPTVPNQQSLLRISLTSMHSEQHITNFLDRVTDIQ